MSMEKQTVGVLARVRKVIACPVPPVVRRLSAAAFLFFLIKGLVWLGVGCAAAWSMMR